MPQGDGFSHAQQDPAGKGRWERLLAGRHRTQQDVLDAGLIQQPPSLKCVKSPQFNLCFWLVRWTCERFIRSFLRKGAEFDFHGRCALLSSSSTADLVDMCCGNLVPWVTAISQHGTMTRFHWVRTLISILVQEEPWPIIQLSFFALGWRTVDQKAWLQRCWKTHTQPTRTYQQAFHTKLKRPTYIAVCYYHLLPMSVDIDTYFAHPIPHPSSEQGAHPTSSNFEATRQC